MALIPILKYPHDTLRRQCAEVTDINDDIRRLADDMVETMNAVNGIGLAAPQVGQCVRLLVANVENDGRAPLRLINPQIIHQAGEITLEEGCLSVPDVRAPVARAREVTVRGLDVDGNEQTIEAAELLAVCLQHEIDHLDGILFFDRISRLKRIRLLSKYKKQQAE